MLDVAISGAAAEQAKAKGDSIWSVHDNLGDFSLFSEYARIRRVPLTAEIPAGEDVFVTDRLEDFNGLYNEATGRLLNTRPIGKSYQLVPHDLLFERQAEMLGESDLPTGNVEVCDRLYDGGLKAHRTVYFHDLKADVGKPGDVVRCRMDVFNSVDMSWAFQIFSGAYRDLCRNTQVFGGMKAYHQKRKHTSNLSPDAIIGKASMGLGMWTGQVELMRNWQRTRLSESGFASLLADTVCKKTGAAADNGHGKPVNEGLMNYLLHRWREEQPELGATLWAGYNALTHWATHTNEKWEGEDGKTRQSGKAGGIAHNIRRVRADAVRAVIESPAWHELEGAAA